MDNMKIRDDDYSRLSRIVLHKVQALGLHKIQDYPGMSVRRYVWDVYHAVCDAVNHDNNVPDYLFLRHLYDYLEDAHLETALKRVLREYLH